MLGRDLSGAWPPARAFDFGTICTLAIVPPGRGHSVRTDRSHGMAGRFLCRGLGVHWGLIVWALVFPLRDFNFRPIGTGVAVPFGRGQPV